MDSAHTGSMSVGCEGGCISAIIIITISNTIHIQRLQKGEPRVTSIK